MFFSVVENENHAELSKALLAATVIQGVKGAISAHLEAPTADTAMSVRVWEARCFDVLYGASLELVRESVWMLEALGKLPRV
jgi:hypothetical protein